MCREPTVYSSTLELMEASEFTALARCDRNSGAGYRQSSPSHRGLVDG